jgi:hypothetical protein
LTILRAHVVEEIAKLEQSAGLYILVTGSATLVQS